MTTKRLTAVLTLAAAVLGVTTAPASAAPAYCTWWAGSTTYATATVVRGASVKLGTVQLCRGPAEDSFYTQITMNAAVPTGYYVDAFVFGYRVDGTVRESRHCTVTAGYRACVSDPIHNDSVVRSLESTAVMRPVGSSTTYARGTTGKVQG